eukprot:TRINITY_DN299_c0_g1_i3.p1 TRINITY_DN299_c0_g1~~TRINITY_DN299_c0_g1_i3.p1  ORF type:complete len:306 (+),score=62.05 TRINITY_DN299_c0_g1_i3:63-980(+)
MGDTLDVMFQQLVEHEEKWWSKLSKKAAKKLRAKGFEPSHMRFYGEIYWCLLKMKPSVIFSGLTPAIAEDYVDKVIIPSGVLMLGLDIMITPSEFSTEHTSSEDIGGLWAVYHIEHPLAATVQSLMSPRNEDGSSATELATSSQVMMAHMNAWVDSLDFSDLTIDLEGLESGDFGCAMGSRHPVDDEQERPNAKSSSFLEEKPNAEVVKTTEKILAQILDYPVALGEFTEVMEVAYLGRIIAPWAGKMKHKPSQETVLMTYGAGRDTVQSGVVHAHFHRYKRAISTVIELSMKVTPITPDSRLAL